MLKVPTTKQELDTTLTELQKRGAPQEALQRVFDNFKQQKLTEQPQQPAEQGRINNAVSSFKSGVSQAGSDISTKFSETQREFGKTKQRQQAGEISAPTALLQNIGSEARLFSDIIQKSFEALTPDVVGEFLTEKGIDAIKFLVDTGAAELNQQGKLIDTVTGQPVGSTVEAVTDVLKIGKQKAQQFSQENPDAIQGLKDLSDVGLLALDIGSLGIGKKAVDPVIERTVKLGGEFIEEGIQKTKSLIKPARSVDELIAEADQVFKEFEAAAPDKPAAILKATQETAPSISPLEKFAGVREDIKARIQGKKEKLKEYFDVAEARNLKDTLPTPLEHAANNVKKARDDLRTLLNDKGGKIGKFREKIATFKATPDDVKSVASSFDDQLTDLNLAVNGKGKIIRAPGRVKGIISDGEIKILQSLRDDIQVIKQAPTVQNLIDLRNAFDERINFAKSAKEASNVIDPISRNVRRTIRDVNLKIVGKEQGKILEDFSDLSGLLKDLNKFVDSNSGGEFLLKRVLSERGRVPREILDKLKDATGIDLMDDAVMSTLAIDLLGNIDQKGTLRKEITKAGLDASFILKIGTGRPGDVAGGAQTLFQSALESLINKKDIFLKAAEIPKTSGKLKPLKEFIAPKSGRLEGFIKPDEFLPGGGQATKAIPKELESLAKEARKFKTADEFVKAQPKVFHGTAGTFEQFDLALGGSITEAKSAKGAIFFVDNQAIAKNYAINAAEQGVVIKALKQSKELELKAKIAQEAGKTAEANKLFKQSDDLLGKAEELGKSDATFERRKLANIKEVVLNGDFLKVNAKGKTPQELSKELDIDSWLNLQIQKAKAQGKDGVIFENLDDTIDLQTPPATHYAVFSNKNIKTKSQLIDIFNQAKGN